MFKRILPVLLTFIFVSELHSSASDAGAVFLTILPGAKATGMGGAFSSIADDGTASYYNPGALAFFKNPTFSVIHAPWLPHLSKDMYYEFAGFVWPLKNFPGNIGGHIIYLDLGNVDAYDENGNYIASWRPHDVAIDVAYGTKINKNLAGGIGIKFIRSFLAPPEVIRVVLNEPGGGSANSFALDAGIFYKTKTFLGKLHLATALTNYGPGLKFTATGETNDLPRTLRLGISLTPLESDYYKLTLAFDVNKVLVNLSNDLKEKGFSYVVDEAFKHIGMEIALLDMISLRAGYFIDKEGARVGPTFGLGFKFKSFRIDLADDSKIYAFHEKSNFRISLTFALLR